MATFAPSPASRSAIALPMPLAPPVTNATRPSKAPLLSLISVSSYLAA